MLFFQIKTFFLEHKYVSLCTYTLKHCAVITQSNLYPTKLERVKANVPKGNELLTSGSWSFKAEQEASIQEYPMGNLTLY